MCEGHNGLREWRPESTLLFPRTSHLAPRPSLMLLRTVIAVGLVAIAADSGCAQDPGHYAAYSALTLTPQGAFAPLAPTFRPEYALRYGRMEWQGFVVNNFAVALRFPGATRSASLTAGILTCHACSPGITVGGDLDMPLASRGRESARFQIELRNALGIALSTGEEDRRAMSASVSVPFSLSAGTELRLTPFFIPGIGFGRLSVADRSEAGIRLMIGLGLALQNAPRTLGATIGMQKILIQDGNAVFGLNVMIRR